MRRIDITSVSIESRKLDLVQLVLSLETEAAIDKVSKYLKRITSGACTNKPLFSETLQMMEESRKDYAEGKYISFDTAEDAQKWLEAL